MEAEGRRERRRREVTGRIVGVAMRLFLERGFDRVTVAEIAREADVVEKTVFNHFPAKADLVFGTGDDLVAELVATVRARRAGEPVVDAVRRFRTAPRGPGRPDGPTDEFLAMIAASPALQAHRRTVFARWEGELAAELAAHGDPGRGPIEAFVVAAALMAVLRAPFESGSGPDRGHAGALAALDLLRDGLRDYGTRR